MEHRLPLAPWSLHSLFITCHPFCRRLQVLDARWGPPYLWGLLTHSDKVQSYTLSCPDTDRDPVARISFCSQDTSFSTWTHCVCWLWGWAFSRFAFYWHFLHWSLIFPRHFQAFFLNKTYESLLVLLLFGHPQKVILSAAGPDALCSSDFPASQCFAWCVNKRAN